MPVPRFRLAVLIFLLCPVLITLWFLHDGGLGDGLNRLAYEFSMGMFFLGYGLLLAVIAGVLRYRQRSCLALGRLSLVSFSACMVWAMVAVLYEQ